MNMRIPIETFHLPNGLFVTLSEDHTAPIVAVNLWYHVGSANERSGRTGFADRVDGGPRRSEPGGHQALLRHLLHARQFCPLDRGRLRTGRGTRARHEALRADCSRPREATAARYGSAADVR